MKCPERAKIVPYLSRQLNRDETKRFETHLQKCPTCSAELNILGQVKKTIAGQDSELPRVNLVGQVMAKLGVRPVSQRTAYKRAAPLAKRKGRGK